MPWNGSKTNMTLNAGDLEIDPGAQEGEYLLQDAGGNNYFDTGAVSTWRINCIFDAEEGAVSPDDDTNEIKVRLFIALNSTDPLDDAEWSDFVPYLPGHYDCRWYRIKVVVKVEDAFQNRPKLLEFTPSHTPVGSIQIPAAIEEIVNEPVGGEEVGHRYLVDPVPVGIFASHANKIAEKIDSTNNIWRFFIPVEGQRIYHKGEDWYWTYERSGFPTGFWNPTDYRPAASLSRSTTTSSTFQTKTTLTTPAYVSGTYRVSWYALIDNNSDLGEFRLRNITDGIDQTGIVVWKANDSNEFHPIGGFAEVVFAGIAKAFAIQFRDQSGGNVQGIQQARIEIWRVR